MSYINWETALVTKAINKTIARKPKDPEKRKILKQKHRQDNAERAAQQ